MRKITSNALSKKRGILIPFLILLSCFIYENMFSTKQWDRDYITVNYLETIDTVLSVKFRFFDFEFGPNKEHAFLEWCDFEGSFDGETFETFAKSETYDQLYCGMIWVFMTNKLPGAKILFHGTWIPLEEDFIPWKESTKQWLAVRNFKNQGSLTLLWCLRPNAKVKKIRITGKWTVSGLNCPYYINDEIYDLTKTPSKALKSEVKNDLKQKRLNYPDINQPVNNGVKIYKTADAVVVKGADLGQNIKVFTTSGTQVKSIITNTDLVRIQLAAKQVYIINIGEAHYKIAL